MALPDRPRRETVARILAFPELYPDEFKAGIRRILQSDPQFTIAKTQVTGRVGENWRVFGATGEPSLQNSWVNFGTPYPNARYRKNYTNEVFVEMAVKNGTVTDGTVLATLPAGYRPDATIPFVAEMNAGVNVRIEIKSNGDIVLARHGAGTNAHLLIVVVFRSST